MRLLTLLMVATLSGCSMLKPMDTEPCLATKPAWNNIERTEDGVNLTSKQLEELLIYIEDLEDCT